MGVPNEEKHMRTCTLYRVIQHPESSKQKKRTGLALFKVTRRLNRHFNNKYVKTKNRTGHVSFG